MKKLFLLLVLGLVSCAPFQPGGSLNPIPVSPSSGLSLKAGSSIYLSVFVGALPNLGISPAALYRQSSSGVQLDGSSRSWARVGIAQLGSSVMPQGWTLSLNGDEVELIASSSSFAQFDTIETQTRVQFGSYRLGANLFVPSGTAAGTYTVQARVGLRGAQTVALEWAVTVTQ